MASSDELDDMDLGFPLESVTVWYRCRTCYGCYHSVPVLIKHMEMDHRLNQEQLKLPDDLPPGALDGKVFFNNLHSKNPLPQPMERPNSNDNIQETTKSVYPTYKTRSQSNGQESLKKVNTVTNSQESSDDDRESRISTHHPYDKSKNATSRFVQEKISLRRSVQAKSNVEDANQGPGPIGSPSDSGIQTSEAQDDDMIHAAANEITANVSNSNSSITCLKCNKTFKSLGQLNFHVKKNHKETDASEGNLTVTDADKKIQEGLKLKLFRNSSTGSFSRATRKQQQVNTVETDSPAGDGTGKDQVMPSTDSSNDSDSSTKTPRGTTRQKNDANDSNCADDTPSPITKKTKRKRTGNVISTSDSDDSPKMTKQGHDNTANNTPGKSRTTGKNSRGIESETDSEHKNKPKSSVTKKHQLRKKGTGRSSDDISSSSSSSSSDNSDKDVTEQEDEEESEGELSDKVTTSEDELPSEPAVTDEESEVSKKAAKEKQVEESDSTSDSEDLFIPVPKKKKKFTKTRPDAKSVPADQTKSKKPNASNKLSSTPNGHVVICIHCKQEFTDPSAFVTHMARFHKEGVLKLICGYCKGKFEGKQKFNLHIKVCQKNKE